MNLANGGFYAVLGVEHHNRAPRRAREERESEQESERARARARARVSE